MSAVLAASHPLPPDLRETVRLYLPHLVQGLAALVVAQVHKESVEPPQFAVGLGK